MAIILAILTVIALALLWGSHLKKKSDAYRAAEEAGAWTLAETVSPIRPVDVPEYRAASILPGQDLSDVVMGGEHEGVLLPLLSTDGTLLLQVPLAASIGLSTVADAPSAADEVARIGRRDLSVIGLFPITFHAEKDPATATYRRGLELALLQEFAAAGFDELLLTGLPSGDEATDRVALAFIQDLKMALSSLPNAPAVGVVLPLSTFQGESTDETDTNGESLPLYAGNPTPAYLLQAADYVVADLRGLTADKVDALLPRFAYAYSRYALRLLCDANSEAVDEALSHGYDRLYECAPQTGSPNLIN